MKNRGLSRFFKVSKLFLRKPDPRDVFFANPVTAQEPTPPNRGVREKLFSRTLEQNKLSVARPEKFSKPLNSSLASRDAKISQTPWRPKKRHPQLEGYARKCFRVARRNSSEPNCFRVARRDP